MAETTGAQRAVVKAAEYVRMSTEHQKYSTENQSDIIHKYATGRGIDIVRMGTEAPSRLEEGP